MPSIKPQKTMSSSKYHQNHLKVQQSMLNDPPLYFYGPSSFLTKTDASSSFHEEVLWDMSSDMLYEGSFAVYVNSSKPYDEFCASMVEMVIFKLDHDLSVDWDYMEELLLCYLELNEKKVYKHILQAFFDVMEVLNIG
ncbi:hypothetical protein Pfo_024919 [Paulownia fortunei]|nr:hypothetical protein Pfo_024919 [Paulownia fortunei]